MDTATILGNPEVATWVRQRLRSAGSIDFSAGRDTGTSSNAMVDHALGGDLPAEADYPKDASDLAACRNARDGAPAVLHERMDAVLALYTEALGDGADGEVRDGLRIGDFASPDALADRLEHGNG